MRAALAIVHDPAMTWVGKHGRLLAAALCIATIPSSLSASLPANLVYADDQNGIFIGYSFDGPNIVFSAQLPKDWIFNINVDGDQDQKWGLGDFTLLPLDRPAPGRVGADHGYGVFLEPSSVCAHYIYSAAHAQSNTVYATSGCGEYHSKARLTLTPLSDGRNDIHMAVPIDEMFGDRQTGNIQACVWDDVKNSCNGSPLEPIVIRRLPKPGAG